ncbi:hypothetical protein Tco_0879062 [Tanacetum coccineum]
MAEENVPAPAPTRSDEQILPFNAWLPKTNFFKAFTTSANVPTIYIQQFWNTLVEDAKTGVYSFQLDEQWFTLNADLLCKALEITPVDSAHPFESPLVGEQVMDFVNKLGYLEEIHFVSKMHVNNLYQPWRAIMSLINQCLTGKTSGNDKPRHPFLQMLWGIVTRSNVDYAELLWEDFVQAIKTFFIDKANLSLPTKKPKPHVIPYCRFTKLALAKQPAPAKQSNPVKEKSSKPTLSKKIHKGKVMKVHKGKRSDNLVDEEDEEDQPTSEPHTPFGGVAIREPVPWITRQLPVVEGKGKGIATDEQAAQSLLDLQKPKKQSTTDQYIFQRRILVTQYATTGPSAQPQDDTSANVVLDTPSPADAETGADTEKSNSEGDTEILNVVEEQGEDVSNMVALEERTVELDEGQVGSDPGKTPESRPPPEHVHMEKDQAESNPGQSHVVLAGPNPEPLHKDFIANVYPQVYESLKLTPEEQVHMENPQSSSGTLLSMKNLHDEFTFGDQFLNDKPTEEEPRKANVETEVESMVTVPIHQASSSAPPLSTPIIDLTPPKPVSPPAQEPIFTAITDTTTTTLLPPPPLQKQSTTVLELATHVSALEKICANFKKK